MDHFSGISDEELRFLDLTKLILDAGWCIDSHSFQEILNLTGIDKSLIQL